MDKIVAITTPIPNNDAIMTNIDAMTEKTANRISAAIIMKYMELTIMALVPKKGIHPQSTAKVINILVNQRTGKARITDTTNMINTDTNAIKNSTSEASMIKTDKTIPIQAPIDNPPTTRFIMPINIIPNKNSHNGLTTKQEGRLRGSEIKVNGL